MPRALWSGSITFGLVNVPVRLYSAVSEHKLEFHFVHQKDNSLIGYQRSASSRRSRPGQGDRQGISNTKGKYVYMDDEDFAAARVEGYKTIEITDFVPTSRSTRSLRAHVSRWASGRSREGLFAARPRDGGLRAGGNREFRDARSAVPRRAPACARASSPSSSSTSPTRPAGRRDQAEARAGRQARARDGAAAHRQLSGEWKPEKYEDTYREALRGSDRGQAQGEGSPRRRRARGEEPADL